jgi:hypothetical protein
MARDCIFVLPTVYLIYRIIGPITVTFEFVVCTKFCAVSLIFVRINPVKALLYMKFKRETINFAKTFPRE